MLPERGEARTAPRLSAAEVPSITGVRFPRFGVDGTLINISASGILVDCTERMKPGNAVNVAFQGTFEPKTVPARVARVSVSGMGSDGRLRYHVALAFVSPIPLSGGTKPVGAEPEPAPQLKVVRNRW